MFGGADRAMETEKSGNLMLKKKGVRVVQHGPIWINMVQIIHFDGIFHEINHLAIGVPPLMETPRMVDIGIFFLCAGHHWICPLG